MPRNASFDCVLCNKKFSFYNAFLKHLDSHNEKEVLSLRTGKSSTTAKDDKGKPKLAFLPPRALVETAKALEHGAKKYGYEAYLDKPGTLGTWLSAALRHMNRTLQGQDVDEESQVSHIAHAASNLLIALELTLLGTEKFDDRKRAK